MFLVLLLLGPSIHDIDKIMVFLTPTILRPRNLEVGPQIEDIS